MKSGEKDVIIEARDLCYSYEEGGERALNYVNLKIERGRKVAFMGANGSGKSTFFLCCNGIFRPESGTLLFDGRPVEYTKQGLLDLRRRVGIVFQDPDNQLFLASVYQEISFGPMNLGMREEDVKREVEQVIEKLEITPFRERPAHALSGGQKKQVSIADVLVMHPEVVILDEPAAALDAKHAKIVREIVDKMAAEGITVLMATHNIDYALEWADEIVLMQEGRVLLQGDPVTVCRNQEALQMANQEPPAVLTLYKKLVEKGVLKQEGNVPRSLAQLGRYIDEQEQG
ncbi:energy-coupling factor ABC transporter ATP-binding protein [Bariatricus massiliensis]|uniref:ABC transporter ATP-binding protein n=1 Tax=Bariatricus massiliensis TaxID=1745713 RepID=A0ABS8DEP4_9FIRM|nr:ABC transporter ATP-binding protein [Bariatricus massiliensis]MCB7302997.1 energy-coupling factor ABC transporter ATP-binding protein [Bariatricus massiliensis]MCB7374213.1 energy-coupling factor ABC transporter ATP-binding protein [Bariatricus massiliensis]MCB7386883.1 energy-coupling factor ABC transporter ATP-binding protein [Bariatricus massiliensis]MCB7411045.1 energy-coupling factor ABC transporter ATP-binding protein [Bariatricus massiliensis]MCQ5251871.1 energy-coupling factor ABC t